MVFSSDDLPIGGTRPRAPSSSTQSCIAVQPLAVETITTTTTTQTTTTTTVSTATVMPPVRRKVAAGARRSTRHEVLDKARGGVAGGLSVLGKRGRAVLEAGKGKLVGAAHGRQRKSSRRVPSPEEKTGAIKGRAAKRTKTTHVFEEDAAAAEPQAPAKPPPPPGPKAKTWLKHGLYVGQSRPPPSGRIKVTKAAAAFRSSGPERAMLPLPMFHGQRLLEVGREFKMPFDVFSPLPPKQPKPEEYRKLSKSERSPSCHATC